MTKAQWDKMAEAFTQVDPERLKAVLKKTESLTIRLTLADKEEMQEAASAFGLTLTDYLTRLHYLAVGLSEKGTAKKSKKGAR